MFGAEMARDELAVIVAEAMKEARPVSRDV
jgi:hypothetical protein